jgi:4'-phosphopantetheinyl transferase
VGIALAVPVVERGVGVFGVAEEAEVVVARLDGSPEEVRRAATGLSAGERERAGRFAFDRDRRRYVLARARLRELLGARLGVPPESIELQYGAHGKPALAGRLRSSGLRFNVSHRDDVALYAFAAGREVGVDLEAVHRLRGADEIAACCFSGRENEMYRALDVKDRPLGFFNCWTRKEAYIKALGDGLSHPLGCFDVSLAPGEPARILRVWNTPGELCGWRMGSFSPLPGFVAAIVTEDR